jgi:hypothetical protein
VTCQDPPPRAAHAPESSFVVFSQSKDARVDIRAWDAHARRFFHTRLGLAEDARGDAVAFVVAPEGEAPGVRTACARPRKAEDLAMAHAADPAGAGLALLAQRCPIVWLVERKSDDDRLALRLSAVLASILLGPILDVRVPELLGVKSARARLERS